MHIFSLWITLLALIQLAVCDVDITSPTTGKSYSASSGSVTVTVKWDDDLDDSDDDASLDNVKKYSVVLCTGSNLLVKPVHSFTTALPSGTTTYDAVIEDTYGPDGDYFIQVYAVFTLGTTIHYTNRFALTGMTGKATTFTFSASLFSITGSHPTAQVNVGADAVTINSASFTVPYTLQTGKTRYAPMQTQPGSTVTYSMYSTRHATSAYTPYSTLRASPNVYSTITPGWSYTPLSKINNATIAGYPTYYYAASSRVTKAQLSSAKKRRWLD